MTGLTDWQIRNAAGISTRQLELFEAKGLIAREADGTWSTETEDTIGIIKALSVVRSLERRAVLLRCQGIGISTDAIQQAMSRVASSITAQKRKLKLVDAVAVSVFQQSSIRVEGDWSGHLGTADGRDFAESQQVAFTLGPMFVPHLQHEDLPLEEIITILTLRALAWRKEQREGGSPRVRNVLT